MIEQHFTLASLPPSIEPASNFGHITSALVSVRIIFRFVFSSKESLLTASFFIVPSIRQRIIVDMPGFGMKDVMGESVD
jgi:hypothetical protein